MEPVKFLPDDPDAATGVPGVMVLNGELAALCHDLKVTIGVRQGGGGRGPGPVDGDGQGRAMFVAFTPVTARALAKTLTDFAARQEAAAGAMMAAALARAGGA